MFENLNKKIKLTLINKKRVKEPDNIVATVPQASNSNANISISSPQLEVQVKKEFNPKESKIVPQAYPVDLQVDPKTSYKHVCHDLDMAGQMIYDKKYLAEYIS